MIHSMGSAYRHSCWLLEIGWRHKDEVATRVGHGDLDGWWLIRCLDALRMGGRYPNGWEIS